MLGNYLIGVFSFDSAIPHSVGINHDRWAVLALVQAAGFVDPHPAAQAGLFRELLQPCMQLAFSIGRAAGPWCIGGAGIVAHKDVMFERRQAVVSLSTFSG